jgi:hypothetical protein
MSVVIPVYLEHLVRYGLRIQPDKAAMSATQYIPRAGGIKQSIAQTAIQFRSCAVANVTAWFILDADALIVCHGIMTAHSFLNDDLSS